MSTGFVLNIPQEMLNRLEDADKKIEKLAKTSEDSRNRIISAFQQINTQGIDAFINKLTEAQNRIVALGNTKVNIGAGMFSDIGGKAKSVIDEVNRVVSAIEKIKTVTTESRGAKNPFVDNGLAGSIAKLNAEIEQAKRNFSELQNRFTHLSSPAGDKTAVTTIQNEAQFLMQYINLLEKERNSLIVAKNALANANKMMQQKDPFKAKVDDLSRESLEALRYKDSMQAMKEFYTEQDKERKKAAKEAEADRKKREKEEKAAADRIAAYDSKARRERYKAYTSTYEGAMRTSDRAKTLLQEQQAIKNLEAARAKLNKTDSDYANKLRNLNQRILEHKNNIDKATAGSKNLQTQHRSLMDISGQLARKLALVFSVSQITGYVKKLIEVRGEFELQQRSLQAILQDKDKANEIWQKTVDLAVRSPFRVKQLVSYTKQLAAYRIESDKLFETNKMLADVSAGLGVDMQRLILAFGQVRSAAYLRGTELRQFTEAGIPILEQLAQYFTELEGRAVSVGDVFERVSKRMVSFADVEEIFRRMTAEGGTFYRMQEIQAETLKGMWTNLKDSIDLMLNEIGKGNESTLKNSLSLVKQLVDNWRSVKPVIETAGISLMAYFGVDVLRKIGRGIKALYATISAHPLLAIVSVLGLIATAIWRVREAQNALTAAMSEVDNEILGSLEESIGLYHKLAETVNDATKSSEERNKALDNLKSRFQDILPDQYLELEYIKQIGDNYKDAEKAMTDYYDAKAQAQKKDRIEGLYAKELDTDTSELISATRDVVSKLGEKGIISGEMQTAMLSGISGIVNNVVEDVKAGKIDANIEKIQSAIFSKLEDYAGYEGYLYGKISESPSLGLMKFSEQVSDVTGTLREYLSALEGIQGLPYETYGQKLASERLNKEKKSLQEISDIYKKLLSLYSKYSKATDEDKVDIADDISLAMSQVPENLNAYLPHLQKSVDKMKGIAEKGAFEFTASMQTLESDFVEGLASIVQYPEGELGNAEADGIAKGLFANLQEDIKKASNKLDMTSFQEAVVGGAREIAAKFGQDVNIFEKFIPNQKEGLSNIRQEVKSSIESFETQIKEMQTSLTLGMDELSEDVLNNTQEKIQSMTAQLPALKAFLALLGETEKDEKSIKILQRRISLLKDVHKQYLELEKVWGSEVAEKKIIEAYSDTFKEAFEGTGVDLDLYKVMTQTIVDAKKVGEDAGSTLTEGMLSKLKELEDAGTYIRTFSDDLVDAIKKNEGFRARAYKDAGGVWTQGYGETQGVERNKTWTQEYAEQRLRLRLTNDYAAAVNRVLDANRDLIITQEQYNALVDLAYQGGGGAVKNLIRLAKETDRGVDFIERIYIKVKKTMGEDVASRFGETFVQSFKEAETIQERMALLLQTMNLTIKGKINKGWYEGMQKRSDERAAMFSGDLDVARELETVLVRIAGMDFKTTEGMVEALNQLKVIAQKEGPEAQKILSKVISEFEAEIGLRIKKEEDEKLKNEVQELFDRYDLSLELKKLNIPPKLAKSLFDVDYLNLDGLKKAVQEQGSKFIGTDMEKEYKKFLDKIDDMDAKAAKERMKTYSKYLLEGMSERVKLKIEEMRKLKEIEESKEFNPDQKKRIKEGISQEAKKAQQSQEWKDFKETDMYTMMFEDLEHYGTEAINMLYQKLSDLKKSLSDLPANEVKEIVSQIEKLENIKIERNPFQELANYRKEVKNIGFSEEELQGQLRGLQEREATAQRIIDVIRLMEQATDDGISQSDALAQLTPEQLTAWNTALSLQKQLGVEMSGVADKQEGIVKKSKENQIIVVEQLSSYQGLSKSQQEAYQKTETWLNAVGDVFSASKELMTALGVESDSVAMTIADTGSSMVSLILSAVQFTAQMQLLGVASNMALGVIGWIAIALQAVATLLSAIFSAKDNALKKQVEGHQRTVENLLESYEELEKKIDEAWSVDAIRQYNAEMKNTMSLAIEAKKASIAAQEQRKGADKEGSDNWQELQDMKAELDEMEQQLEDSLKESFSKITDGILDDVFDAAKEFTDAWYEAFKETGDGLSGLEENFNEMFMNLAKNQAAMQITGAFVEEWKEDLKKYLNDTDTRLTPEDAKAWAEEVRETFPELSEALEAFLGVIHETVGESGELSALSKSIQGVSESTAQVLEALLNSMRFYVADSNAKLTQLLNNMMSGETESPMLAELRAQTKWMRDIYNLINGMTATHPSGGRGIKTVM